MAKLTLTDVTSGYSTPSTINANYDAIEAALENTLSRDGTSPNTMSASLDMNSQRIINLPDAVGNQEPITLSQASTLASISTTFSKENVGGVLWARTTAEINAGVTPTYYYYAPGDIRRYGAALDGVTNDYTALANAISVCATHPTILVPGTLSVGTDTVITIPTGGTVIGTGPTCIVSKTSGSADIFTTTGSNITVGRFRMVGPDNTTCDGFTTDGGTDINVFDLEGYQLASTVTIGLTTTTNRVKVSNVYSEDNAQQGVHINKSVGFEVSGCKSTGCGTTVLHHGIYIGNCTDGTVHDNVCWSNSGSGIHVNAQSTFTMERVLVHHNIAYSNGTVGSGSRAGILVNRDSTSTANEIGIHDNICYNNGAYNLLVTNLDYAVLSNNQCDGNADTTTNGIYISADHASMTGRVTLHGGRSREHASNIRLVAATTATLNISIDNVEIIDADAGGSAGIFANGAGTINLTIGGGNVFSNNTTDVVYSPTAGTKKDYRIYEGSTTWDPASLVDGAGSSTSLTVTGAALGDYVDVSFSNAVQGMILHGWVSSSNTVGVRLQNETTGTLDLASGTLYARVSKPWQTL